MQILLLALHQAPGVARSMWAAGDDLSRTIQIRALQDVPAFVAFTDKGQYINNPPFDPKELKNDLAAILQTFVVTHSLAQKSWWALQMGEISMEYFGNLHGPQPLCTVR